MKKVFILSLLALFSICIIAEARDMYAPSKHVNTGSTIRQRHADASIRQNKQNVKTYAAAAKINYDYQNNNENELRSRFHLATPVGKTLQR